ncbi:MAG: hypothetical protein ACFFCD_14625 [Promethearchaeota archaeon]
MLQSFFFLHSRTKKVLVWKELIKNGSLDADIISSFVETVSKVVETTFPTDIPTGLSEMTMNYGDNFLVFRYGAYVIGILQVGLESKRFGTILTETVFELEARLAEEFKKDVLEETVIAEVSDIVLKNFQDLIFQQVEDIGDVKYLLDEKEKFYWHVGREGATIYETKKKTPSVQIFINSYDTITEAGVDEAISVLRTDLVNFAELNERVHSLNEEDLALTLRQLLRLNAIDCYIQPPSV